MLVKSFYPGRRPDSMGIFFVGLHVSQRKLARSFLFFQDMYMCKCRSICRSVRLSLSLSLSIYIYIFFFARFLR